VTLEGIAQHLRICPATKTMARLRRRTRIRPGQSRPPLSLFPKTALCEQAPTVSALAIDLEFADHAGER